MRTEQKFTHAQVVPQPILRLERVVTKPDTSKSGIREETGPNLVRALGMFSDSHTRTRIDFELFGAQ